MKHFYLIYLLPCTLVRAKGTSKVPPFLSLMRLSPDDSSGGNTWTCFWFCFFCLFVAVVICRSWGAGESVFHWHHDRKKGMKSQGKFLLSKRNAASVCIYNCLEWDCLQTDIIFRSRRYIVLAMVKLSFFSNDLRLLCLFHEQWSNRSTPTSTCPPSTAKWRQLFDSWFSVLTRSLHDIPVIDAERQTRSSHQWTKIIIRDETNNSNTFLTQPCRP